MKTSAEITDGAQLFFDFYGDALKVVGAGNAAGLFGMVAVIGTIHEGHQHTEILLKPAAVIFGLGVLAFALAYLFLTYAFVYCHHYASILEKAELGQPAGDDPNPPMKASITFMRRMAICGLASAFIFFVGLVISGVALIRY